MEIFFSPMSQIDGFSNNLEFLLHSNNRLPGAIFAPEGQNPRNTTKNKTKEPVWLQ